MDDKVIGNYNPLFDSENITGKYILDGKNPVPEPNLFKWGDWCKKNFNNRHVGDDLIKLGRHHFRISTVFLTLDHNHKRFDGGSTIPILFETMIFKSFGESFYYQKRYSTWDEAEKAHKELVEFFKSAKSYKRLKEKFKKLEKSL